MHFVTFVGERASDEVARIAKQKDKMHQRMNMLRKWDVDCADTVIWLNEHRQLFRQEVFDPAVVSLSVPDQRYASAVESCLNANQMKASGLDF